MKKTIYTLFALVILLFVVSGASYAQCNIANAIYVTPNGTGSGTATSPTDLLSALNLYAHDTTKPVLMANGNYTFYQTLRLPSGIHLEGGYNVNGSTWSKSASSSTNIDVYPNYLISTFVVPYSNNDTVTVAGVLGIQMDSVSNILLKDFNLFVAPNNNDIYAYYSALEGTRDGYSVYAVYANSSSNIVMLNLTLSPGDGGNGGQGINGYDGAYAYGVQGGGLEIDTAHTTNFNQPVYKLAPGASATDAGGAGGLGGPVQQMLVCNNPSCISSGCMLQTPPPTGQAGGQVTGGAGGACGSNCEWSCWLTSYENALTAGHDSALLYLIAGAQVPNVPSVSQVPFPGVNGSNGADGGSNLETGLAFEGNAFYIPGQGPNGIDGGGGGGGGGGGAGGIMTVDVPSIPFPLSEIPALEATDKALSALQGTIALEVAIAAAAGTDLCSAYIINYSTPGGPGGGGGQGGQAGGGGGGGGSVYGIYAYECTNITPGNITYNLGQPGSGGQGGYGGDGGAGSIGYPGPPASNGITESYQGATGGAGGQGGQGGQGGTGTNGKQYQTYGLYAPVIFAVDTPLHACTNSVIGFVINSSSQLDVFGANGHGLTPISSTPTYVEYSVSSPQTLFVEEYNPQVYGYNPYYVAVTTSRPLPAFSIPSTICWYDTMTLTASDTTASEYLWQVYLGGNLVGQSTLHSWKFVPSDTSASAVYSVNLKEYSTCCGWSVPATHSFLIEQPYHLTVTAGGIIPPYCAGQYSTTLTLNGEPYTVTGSFPNYVYHYPGVAWTTGQTDTNIIHISNNGTYSATYTSPEGCLSQTAQPYAVQSIFPNPTGAPTSPNFEACTQTTLQLYATYPGIGTFDYYIDSTTPFTISGAYQTPFVSWETNFVPGTNQADSNIIWAAAIDQNGCSTPARGKVVVHRIDLGIYVTQPFTNYYHEISPSTSCGAQVNYQIPTGTDYCGDYVWATQISGQFSGSVFPIGTSNVLYRLYDFYGDSTDVPITIQVQDETPPSIYVNPNITVNNTTGLCSALVHLTPPYGTDNCETIVVPTEYWTGLDVGDTIFGVGTTSLTYVFKDPSGNTTIGYTNVTVADNQPPTLTCPANQVYYVGPRDTAVFVGYNAPTAIDNCDTTGGGMSPWEVSGFPQFGYHSIGVTNQIWADTDWAGNMGSCQFTIDVKDTIAPVLTCPGPLGFLANVGYDYTTINYPAPTAVDILGGPVTISLVSGKASGDTASLGVYTSIWQGVDIYGNTGTCPVKITVSSNQPPNLTCPNNIVTQNDSGLCTAKVDYAIALASDVDGHFYEPTLFSGLDSGAAFPFGITNVVYTATDIEGNRGFCSFTVTVQDTIAPVFTTPCPHDTTINLNPAVCGAQLFEPVLTGVSYDCVPPSIGIWSGVSNYYFTLGTTTQQYRIIDDHGNYNICQYNVTVVDNNNPTVACPSDITVNNDPGKCTAYLPNYGTPILTPYYDLGCVNATVTANQAPNFLIGTTQARYSAYVDGYSLGCTWNITVVNTEKPHIVSPPNIMQAVTPGNCGNIINFTAPVGTDTCSNGVGTYLVSGLASGSLFPVGTTVEIYVVSDLQGNTDTARFTITVLDTVKPTLTNPGNIVDSTSTMCGMVINFNRPVAADNSGCVTMYLAAGLDSGSQFPLGVTNEIYVARDSAGNTDTVTFTVTVKAIYPLDAGCIDNWPLADAGGNGQIIYYPVPGTTDQYTGQLYACPGVSIHLISGIGSGGFFTPGPHNEVYQFIATGTGDTVNCTTLVIDAPVYSYPNINCGTQQYLSYPDNTATCTAVVPIPQVTASEGNIPVTLTYTIDGVQSTDSIDTLSVGVHSIQYTAIDYFGGRATCSIYINVSSNMTVSPNFINVNTGRATYCQNEAVTLNPNLGGNLTGATFAWITLDSLGSYYAYSTDSALHFNSIQPSNENQYHFVATDQCGATVSIGEFTLMVDTAPATTISGLDTGYCIYDSSNYTITVSPAGGTIAGPGVTGNTFNPRSAGLGPHTISYSLTDTTGCTGVSTINVTVYNPPTDSLFADSVYCINLGPIQLPSTNSTYTGAGINGTVFSPATAGSGYHTITRTVTQYGCSTQLSQTVRVNGTIPDAAITAPAAVCEGSGTYTLLAATSGGAWAGNYVAIDSSGKPLLNTAFANPGFDTIRYSITKNACSSADTVVVRILNNSDSLPYTFPQYCISGPPVAFDTTGGKSYFGIGFTNNIFFPDSVGWATGIVAYNVMTINSFGCRDTSIRLLALLGGLDIYPYQFVCPPGDSVFVNLGNEYDSIHWSFGSSSNQLWFTDTGSYPVFLRDTGGCTGMDTLRIYQYPAPSQIVPTTTVYACPGNSVTITAYDSSVTSYLWNNGDTSQAINVSPGSYVVTVTTTYGCKYKSSPVIVSSGPDTIKPVITCAPDTVLYTTAGSCALGGVVITMPQATDNCGIASVTSNGPLNYPVGITEVTWTARDSSNNTKTCVQKITVMDTIKPYFTTLPASGFVTDTTTDDCSTRLPDLTGLFSASDSCSGASISQNPSAGTFVTSGVTPVEIIATDSSGNTVHYYMVFQTSDTVKPILNCPGDITITITGSATTAQVNFTAPTHAENCTNSTVQLIAGMASGSAFPIGTTTEKYVVTDGAGATDTCSFDIKVNHVTGIVEYTDNSNSLSVMPIPTTDNLTVIYNNTETTSLHVKLTNTTGQQIIDEDVIPFNGSYNKTFDLRKQAAGTYILEIISDNEIITRKVVKL